MNTYQNITDIYTHIDKSFIADKNFVTDKSGTFFIFEEVTINALLKIFSVNTRLFCCVVQTFSWGLSKFADFPFILTPSSYLNQVLFQICAIPGI